MAIELIVPAVGESITEVQIGEWLKAPGEFIKADEPVVEVESDKATVEIFAPVSGSISEIRKQTGETAQVGEIIGIMEAGEAAAVTAESTQSPTAEAQSNGADSDDETAVMPAARRILAEAGVLASQVSGTGSGGRISKEDAVRHVEQANAAPPASTPVPVATIRIESPSGPREEEIVPMSPMRKRIAEALVAAQQNAALLTTFNEVDLSAVKALRAEYKEEYQKKYGVKLGFMSFFVKASIEALKEFPRVNSEIRGTDIVYKNYYDIGIAVGGGKGLVVPNLRNAERMSFAEIELAIGDLGKRAAKNKIGLDELKGGTFTISNGGIYGSMLSTPIVNAPQSAILGMHNIEDRAVVRDGEIVIRPMMFLALSYDHRVVDGREAVSFLVRIKQCLENPARILLEV